MLQSQLFYRTKKDIPKDIEAVSHKLLYKGDFIDQLGAGIYSFLPLGWKVLDNIARVIREEMLNINGQELFLPSLHPKQIWQKTKRWETINPPLFKLKDRHHKDFALGSTHEEVITKLVKERIRSYKELPQALFQIQTKFRNELRYTGGLLRTREFLMKDLYSFHAHQKDFEKYYQTVARAYLKIFTRCGVEAVMVEASGAGFTSALTHEFQVFASVGEDVIIFCPKCSFAQNKEIAKSKPGDKCPKCKTVLEERRGIEVGNIFPLGTKYSEDFQFYFIDKDGKEKLPVVGCYGIGLGRLMAAVVEVNNDKNGIIWPLEIAPFKIHIIPVEIDDRAVRTTAEKICQDRQKETSAVLLDDRPNKNIGEKLVEADLIGAPYRIVVSKKTLKCQCAEVKQRNKQKADLIKLNQLSSSALLKNKK